MNEKENVSENPNPFALAASKEAQGGAAVQIMQSRQAQEIQAAMLIAKGAPRNEMKSYERIMNSCRRPGLAAVAIYTYPRGTTQVEGPTIRLAEAIAAGWGNMDYGIVELEQRPGESVCMAYAWDLETNLRRSMTFVVKHQRSTKKGAYQLDDPRDIYEMVANQGSRRVRNCILGVVPGDVVEAAMNRINKTLVEEMKDQPLVDRIRAMVELFSEEDVTLEMLEKRMQHKVSACSAAELIQYGKIYRALKEGHATREDYFPIETTTIKPAEPVKQEPPKETPPPKQEPPKEEPPAEDAKKVAAEQEAQEKAKALAAKIKAEEEAKVKAAAEAAEAEKNKPSPEERLQALADKAKADAAAKKTPPPEEAPAPNPLNTPANEVIYEEGKPAENLVALMDLCEKDGIAQDVLMAWLKSSRLITGAKKIENVRDYPKRLAFILNNWFKGNEYRNEVLAAAKKG